MTGKKLPLKTLIITISVALTTILIQLPGCQTTHVEVPEEVCTYGQQIISLGQYICDNVPDTPTTLCDIIDIARANLEVLCNSQSTAKEKEEALNSLNEIAVKINNYHKRLVSEGKLTKEN